MEAISDYFASNPAAFTMLAIFIALFVLYSIFQKMLKLAIVVIFVVLVVGGVYFFKDPGSMPDKIKQTVTTFKDGSQAISDKFTSLWSDSKELAGKMKKAPSDINKMLDASKEQVGK